MSKAQDLKRGSVGERIEALQASMKEHGVDLVIVGPTTNMRYLTGYGVMAVGTDHGPRYTFAGLWTGLVSIAVIQSDLLTPAFGVIGLILAPLFLLGSMEFVGSNEKEGWRCAGTLVPVAFIGWSLWLLAMGLGLLI